MISGANPDGAYIIKVNGGRPITAQLDKNSELSRSSRQLANINVL